MLMDFLLVLAALTQRKESNNNSKEKDKYQLIKDVISGTEDHNKKMSVANGYLERIFENINKHDIIKEIQSDTKTYGDLKLLISDGLDFIHQIDNYKYIDNTIKIKCQSKLLNKFLKYNQLLHGMDKIIKDENIPIPKKIDCIIKLSK